MDIEKYLRKVSLFDEFTDADYQMISNFAEIINYKKDEIIIKEGSLADCCYICIRGSVQVFTVDKDNKIIILARLNENNYFGEQAYLNNLIRTASVKALTDVQLIKINYALLDPIFKRSAKFRQYLAHLSLKKSIANLQAQMLSINYYLKAIFKGMDAGQKPKDKLRIFLNKLLEKIGMKKKNISPNALIKCFNKNDIIFKQGDLFDYVYLISIGTVSLTLGEKEIEQEYILTKNNIFGELGVLENKPRAATARAVTPVTLIAVKGDVFLNAVKHSRGLQLLTTSLKRIYALPKNKGIVNQFIGTFQNSEAIFTIYQLPNGKTVTCAKIIDQAIFTIKVENTEPDKTLIFERGKLIKRIIMFKDSKIIGITTFGEWDEINILCEVLLEGNALLSYSEADFLKSGNLLNLSSKSVYHANDTICNCMHVTFQMINKAVKQGCCQLADISRVTGAGTACGACRNKILDILDQSTFFYATMKLHHQYNDDVCSFLIKPLYGKFPAFYSGQYIILKMQINSLWIERAYSLISYAKNTDYYEIMVKQYPTGTLTPWLFQHKDATLFVWVSRPCGDFILKNSSEKPILCFAGGIGIAPFLSFIQDIDNGNSSNSLRLFYAVPNQNNILLPENIKLSLNASKTLQIEIWDTSLKGLIDESTIETLIKNYNPELVYICGATGFKSIIVNQLKKMNFNEQHIFTEQFLPATE